MKRKTPKVNYRELMPPDEGGADPGESPRPEATQPPPVANQETAAPSEPPAPPIAPPPTDPVPDPAGDLPPNRRRDRSRPLTPRELAAVLNEHAPRPDALRPSASLSIGGEESPAVEPSMPVDAGTLATDTMEFAVATAAAALPFRDRVKARQGTVDLLLFHVGQESFAADLAAVEEAVERGDIHDVPEAPPNLIGVVDLRGRLIHVYSPEAALGVRLQAGASALLVVRSEGRRLALAIDDVDDVMSLPLPDLRDVPAGTDPSGVLLGVAWRGDTLIALLDVEMLTQSLAVEPVPEPA